MKKGDIVTIHDGSWTGSVVNGKLVHEFLADVVEQNKHYAIIETGCSFPLQRIYCGQPSVYRNDTVIQAIDSGKVVFIHNTFLRPVVKSVREVTMAEVCAQFGEDVKIKKD